MVTDPAACGIKSTETMVLAKVVLNRNGQSMAVDDAIEPQPGAVGDKPSVVLTTLLTAAI